MISKVHIKNPNPHRLSVLVGDRVIETLSPFDNFGFIRSDEMRLVYAGKKAIVGIEIEGGDDDGEQWVQAIGREPVRIDPSLAESSLGPVGF